MPTRSTKRKREEDKRRFIERMGTVDLAKFTNIEGLAANEDRVRELLEALRVELERWVNEKVDAGGEVGYMDTVMAAMNFYKMVVVDVVERTHLAKDPVARVAFFRLARGTIDQSFDRLIQQSMVEVKGD